MKIVRKMELGAFENCKDLFFHLIVTLISRITHSNKVHVQDVWGYSLVNYRMYQRCQLEKG